MYQPLQSIRILDLARLLPGPFLTQLLSDLGAEVIKVEPPWGALGRIEEFGQMYGGAAPTFHHLNLNKKDLAINTRTPEGLKLMQELIKKSDIIINNFAPGTMEKMGWIGDGNNVANSWISAALRLDFSLYLACPEGYAPDTELLDQAKKENRPVFLGHDPKTAVAGAQVINPDVWASMGQESEAAARKEVFQPYQVNAQLLKAAPPEAIVLHCLPAHRGEEITDEVLDGPQSAIWDQAENRLHFQKALLEWLLG